MRAVGKSFILILMLLSIQPSYAIDWPDRSVLGVIGSSFADCRAPVDSPLMGVGYAGCSYEALAVKLQKNKKLDRLNITVQSVALGGGVSYDIPDTGWIGFLSQYNQLVSRTSWFDGKPRLKYILISIPNDCLHSISCTEQEMKDGYIENVKQVIDAASQTGVTVIINGYPEWSDLNMDLIALTFGLTNVIDEAGYNLLKKTHFDELSILPGVVYLMPWSGNFNTIDGLHPREANIIRAARIITHKIKALEGRQ